MEQKREHQQEEEFLTELGQRYTEQQEEERNRLSELKAPKALDDWFQEFRDKTFEQEEAAAELSAGLPERISNNKRKSSTATVLKRVAVFALILLGVGVLGASIRAEAFPFDLWKIFTKDEGTNVVIENTDKMYEMDYYLSSNWYGFYVPTYLPEGYEFVEESIKDRFGELIFKSDKKTLKFYIFYNGTVTAIDTEKAGYSLLQVNDEDLYYSVSQEGQMATAYIDGYTIKMSYQEVLDDEIEKIFINLKKNLN
ncbi:MAG: DUF4367 domain-containing protein [Lachnospiraceae bacterium]|nr:DUF4367 domain-containing protein [Lachnospiraceae bacterium]